MNFSLKNSKKDRWIFVLLLLATIFRLVLSQALHIHYISASAYDDALQISHTFSLTNGDWMGDYGNLTLVKGVGFPILSAIFHWLHIPYILGFHLIYIGVCVFFIFSVRPILKNKWLAIFAYLFLLFNPVAFATPLTRLYRDIGYYSIAFFCVSAILGFLLRFRGEKTAPYFGLLSGISLGFIQNYREDNHWLYLYLVACYASWFCLYKYWQKKNATPTKALIWQPAIILIGWLCIMVPVASLNLTYYNTFTTDEYNSGAYARAYGALKRIDGGLEDPTIVIPEEKRMELYQLSPAFNELYSQLDAPGAPFEGWKIAQGEYRAGYFSFILRDAVASLGYYSSPASANEYYERLAKEVNQICDSGLIQASGPKNGIAARYYSWMGLPIAKTTVEGIVNTLTCHGVTPTPIPTDASSQNQAEIETYFHQSVATNLTPTQSPGLMVIQFIITLYRYTLPILFPSAILLFFITFIHTIRKKLWNIDFFAHTLATFSLLCLFVVRVCMIAFVHVSSFSSIYNPAYMAAGYPIVLAFIATAFCYAFNWLTVKHQPNP